MLFQAWLQRLCLISSAHAIHSAVCVCAARHLASVRILCLCTEKQSLLFYAVCAQLESVRMSGLFSAGRTFPGTDGQTYQVWAAQDDKARRKATQRYLDQVRASQSRHTRRLQELCVRANVAVLL